MFLDLVKKLYTFTYYISNYSMRFWDFFHGTDFTFIDKPKGLDVYDSYYGTPWTSLFFLKRYIDKNLCGGKNRSILDIGCGKGFILYFFSLLHFKKVSGIEYERRRVHLAKKNLKTMLRDDKRIPDIYCGNAAAFKRYDLYDTFYLYNPFDRDMLEQVVLRILSAERISKKPLLLFYCNPLYADVLLKYGFKETARFYYKTKVYVFWEER